MSDKSNIEWTDATWNPVRGCVKVSPGCANCYAETFAERFRGVQGHPYEQGFDLRLVPEKLTEPLSWKKPRRVFVNSMSDLFQDGVPDSYIDQVFAVMALCPQHTFQVLTKRPERMFSYFASFHMLNSVARAWNACAWGETLGTGKDVPALLERIPKGLPNVWLGVSCENQHFADERIPLLLQTPAAVRFISAEPLLGPLILGGIHVEENTDETSLDWIIVGGESGPGARPFDIAWARSIVQQCAAAGVPCFVKQLGAAAVDSALDRERVNYATHSIGATDGRVYLRLKQSKGGDQMEWPADLRVREFPNISVPA